VESQKRLVVGRSARNCCLGLSIVSNCSVDENCTYFLVGSFFVSFLVPSPVASAILKNFSIFFVSFE
jgi:hypothetical protein